MSKQPKNQSSKGSKSGSVAGSGTPGKSSTGPNGQTLNPVSPIANTNARKIKNQLMKIAHSESQLKEALPDAKVPLLEFLMQRLSADLDKLEALADNCTDEALLSEYDTVTVRCHALESDAGRALLEKSLSSVAKSSDEIGAEGDPAHLGTPPVGVVQSNDSSYAPPGEQPSGSNGQETSIGRPTTLNNGLVDHIPQPKEDALASASYLDPVPKMNVPGAFAPTSQQQPLASVPNLENVQQPCMPEALASTNQPEALASPSSLNPLTQVFVPSHVATANLVNALPKINIEPYDGNPLQWGDWFRKYTFLIDSLQISANQKMAYLQGLVTGRARDAIQHFSCNGELYLDALATLEKKFGEPEVVVHHFLDKLSSLKPLTTNRPESYTELASFLNGMIRNFHHLGYHEDLASTSNLRLVTSKLPYSEQLRWQQYLVDHKEKRANLTLFNDWFQPKAEVQERMSRLQHQSPQGGRPGPSNPQITIRAAQSEQRNSVRDNLCPLEDGNHPLYRCEKFKSMAIEERHALVMKGKRCFNCLRVGHGVKDCTINSICREPDCGKKHHTLLHGAQRSKLSKRTNVVQTHDCAEKSTFANVNPDADVMLQVLPVELHNGDLSMQTYAFLDPGSDFSILLDETATKLQLPRVETQQLTLSGINQTAITETSYVNLEISQLRGAKRHPLRKINVLKKANMPKIHHQPGSVVREYPHLRHVAIPTLKDASVTLLLGLDVLDLIWPEETIKGPKGAPYACRCALGWTICGPHSRLPYPKKESAPKHGSYACQIETRPVCEACVQHDQMLAEEVKSWYQAESLGQKQIVSDENLKATEILERSYCKDETGRIELAMLWANDNSLPNNRAVAERHLNWTLSKMSADPALLEKYDDGIQGDLEKGFIREIKDPAQMNEGWLIPHMPVTNPNKPGKVRRVLNASSKFKGTSLNDNLLIGPDLIGDLLGILLRFRENPVAITSDVEAMFMQVGVTPGDRKFLRFLWRKSKRDPIRLFEYSRHIFGKVDSPTCACYALMRAIAEYIAKYPDLENIARKQFYMDDFLDSLRTVLDAIICSQHLDEALSNSHFNLTKWASNSEEFLRAMKPESLAKPIEQLLAPDNVERVLGAHWQLSSDKLLFRVPPRLTLESPITQRKLLSFVASLFDPLGLAGPLVIRIKILLQEIWKDGQSWDKPIQENKTSHVETWASSLKTLQPVSIPRKYFPSATASVELHVFCDASLEATAVVAYFRFLAPGGKGEVSFVLGKTRVAPIKQQTIPKLELQAAVYAVRIRKSILSKTRMNVSQVFHWTDSTSVLCWIRNPKEKHKMFVANRLSEILEESSRSEWNHIPGKDNPADDGTRGLPVEYMTSSARWITGPPFLKSEADWPPEFNASPAHNSFALSSKFVPTLTIKYCDTSTWLSLVSKVKRVLRAVTILRKKPQDEFKLHFDAKSLLFSQSVRETFPKEIESLQNMRPVGPKSRIVNFSPFLDDEGMLRSSSRIKKAPVSVATATPLILDAKHHIVRLFLEYQHEMFKHVGVEQMRNNLQQRFWIVGLRTALRSIVHRCFDCRRQKALNSQPQMADLPAYRFSATPVAFQTVGIDFFGPFGVCVSKKIVKRYVCLFTCLVVRAVHLEVCEDLSTESCLFALRRFVARRGRPNEIHSDNGTNFQGSARVLARNQKEILKKLQSSSASLEIKWKFNPPSAPHFGGVWERLVGMSKRILFTIAGSQNLYPETFATLVCEVESTLNDRPLTTVGSDVQDMESLTPSHFLIGRANSNPVEFSQLLSCQTGSKKLYGQMKEVLQQFWVRLMKEFVTSLRDRPKWQKSVDLLKVGDLVWLLEPNTPRGIWPLGRVIEVYPGSDGIVRSCKVKTQHCEVIKPVVKLAAVIPETSGTASRQNKI